MITGVQIHNWANNFEDDSPNLELVAPTAAYVVVNGVKTHVDLSAVPVSSRGGVRVRRGRRVCKAACMRLLAAPASCLRSRAPTARVHPPTTPLPSHPQPLTPRQTKLINGTPDLAVNQGGAGVLMEEQPDFSYDSKEARRTQRERLQK